MSLTYPDNPFQDGDLIPATRWNGRWTAIQQKFGQIVDADIASDAAINGAKLATGTMPGDRISAGMRQGLAALTADNVSAMMHALIEIRR